MVCLPRGGRTVELFDHLSEVDIEVKDQRDSFAV
jgi:hypothetical protein